MSGSTLGEMSSAKESGMAEESSEDAGSTFVSIVRYQARRKTPQLFKDVEDAIRHYLACQGASTLFQHYYTQAIRIAIASESSNLLEFLLTCADPGTHDLASEPDLIHRAILSRSGLKEGDAFERMQQLIMHGASVEGHNRKGGSAVYYGCVQGWEHDNQVRKVQLLVEHGADVNGLDSYDNSPLFYACIQGCQRIFEILSENGANIRAVFKPPALESCHTGLADEPADLLQLTQYAADARWPTANGLDGAFDRWGMIILDLLGEGLVGPLRGVLFAEYLSVACQRGDLDTVRILLAQDFPNHKDNLGPALVTAVLEGRSDITKLLLAAGVDHQAGHVDLRQLRRFEDGDYISVRPEPRTVIAAVCDEWRYDRTSKRSLAVIQACELLLELGLSREEEVKLLHEAIMCGHIDLVKQLWKAGHHLRSVPETGSIPVLEYLASEQVAIDWPELQLRAFEAGDLNRLRQLVDLHGCQMRNSERLMVAIARLSSETSSTITQDQLALAKYLVQCFSTATSPDHAIVLKIVLRHSYNQPKLLRWLLERVEASNCPGSKSAVVSELNDRQPTGRYPWFDERHVERAVCSLQLMAEHVLRHRYMRDSFSDAVWLTPRALYAMLRPGVTLPPQPVYSPIKETNTQSHHTDIKEVAKAETHHGLHALPSHTAVDECKYRYDDLSGPLPIRLLSIEAAKDQDSPMICKLFSTSLAKEPVFEALSYVWGEPRQSAVILVNGAPMTIRHNLLLALNRLRSADHNRTVWVDAICINQKDLAEKNRQIQAMRQIYQSAARVVIWLGEAALDSNLVFEHEVQPVLGSPRLVMSRNRSEGGRSSSPVRRRAEEAYYKLCLRPWFFRTWVIQELALSKEALVLCGNHSAEWSTLFRKSRIQPTHTNAVDGACGSTRMWALKQIWDDQKSGYVCDGVKILRYSSLCEVTDPRDKVYGLLGLLNLPDLEVDYSASVDEVFTSFAKSLMIQHQQIHILHVFPATAMVDVPTWVPNMFQSGQNSFQASRLGRGRDPRDRHLIKVQPGFRFDGSTMIIKGMRVDMVRYVGQVLSAQQDHAPGSPPFLRVIQDWEMLADTLPDERVPSIFLQTLQAQKERPSTIDIAAFKFYEHYCSGWLKDRRPQHFRSVEVLMQWCPQEHINSGAYAARSLTEIKAYCYGRRFFITKDNRMGLAPERTEEGDLIVFLTGGLHPFVLRQRGPSCTLIGDCYLSAFDEWDFTMQELLNAEEFHID